MRANADQRRCAWCDSSELYQTYHDSEWGFPVRDEYRLFEKICLEGFQSGLSWLTILRKREAFREAFAQFDFFKVAKYGAREVESLMRNAAIVRHRGKIEAVIHNAGRAIVLKEECGDLSTYFWRYEVDVRHRPALISADYLQKQGPAPQAIALAKDLKARGWKFVGPTTVYAFMQSMGLVNDHESQCFIRDRIKP